MDIDMAKKRLCQQKAVSDSCISSTFAEDLSALPFRKLKLKEKRANHPTKKLGKKYHHKINVYLKAIENEVFCLQKENTLFNNSMLKKLKCLCKLKAENLYLKTVIKRKIATKALLIKLNKLFTSKKSFLVLEKPENVSSEVITDISSIGEINESTSTIVRPGSSDLATKTHFQEESTESDKTRNGIKD